MRAPLGTTLSIAALFLLGACGGGSGQGTCGDGLCGGDETLSSCPEDCTPNTDCGNGTCEAGEDPVSCAEDCPSTCGNGACEPGEDEQDATNACPQDCGTRARCGNELCEVGETAASCSHDCLGGSCGNGTCDAGEDGAHCPQDCFECSLIETAATVGDGCSRDVICGPGGVCVGGQCQQVCTPQCKAACGSHDDCNGVFDGDGNPVEFRPGVDLAVCVAHPVGSGVAYDDCAPPDHDACGQDLTCSPVTGMDSYDPFCFPSCTGGEPCPAKDGVSGECALQDDSGNAYCALICDTGNPTCPTGMECVGIGQGTTGICMWPKS